MTFLIGLIVVLALLVGGGFAVASIQANHARVLEAQVALTAQHTAAASSAGLVLTLGLVIVGLLAVMGGYVWLRLRVQRAQRAQWASGPNAGWKRLGDNPARAELAAGGTEALVQQLVQLQVLSMLRDMQAPHPQRSLPVSPREDAVWYPEV